MENILQDKEKQKLYYGAVDEIVETLLSDDSLLYDEIKGVMGNTPMTARKIRNRILRKYGIEKTVNHRDIQRLSSKISFILRVKGYTLDKKGRKAMHQVLYVPQYKQFNELNNGSKKAGDIHDKKV